MKIIKLLLHSFIILDITSLICFPQSSSADDEEVDSYKYEEALEYCAKEGPMKMPYYSSHFESLGSCKTIGGPNSGKPCIFPFIWRNETFHTFHGCPEDPSGRHWCSTKVNSSGYHITRQNEFGYCSKNCPHQCYTLLQQGPCQNNHWLVASEFADKPSAECKIRICEEGEIHFNGECHKNDSNSLCGESQVLLLNPFGEGECHCQNDFLEDYDDQDRLHCYKENSQGPCEDGEKFIQLDEEDENGAQSIPICSTESPNFEIKTQILRFGKKCSNGKFYDIITRRCLKTHRHKKKPKCSQYKKALDCVRAVNKWKKNQRRNG